MDLQKGPLGILGWFALKVTGRNPTQFGDAVVPVVEVGDNYLATSELQLQRIAVSLGIGVSFASATFTVPQGKVWRLIAASVSGGPNVADVAFSSVINVAVQSPNSAPFTVLLTASPKDPGGAAARQWGAAFRPPIFLPSGWSVVSGIFFSANATVAANQQIGIFYQETEL